MLRGILIKFYMCIMNMFSKGSVEFGRPTFWGDLMVALHSKGYLNKILHVYNKHVFKMICRIWAFYFFGGREGGPP